MTQTFTQSKRSLTDRSKKVTGVLWIALAMMIVALTPRMWAQDNATIDGNVTDVSGAVVAHASVMLTDNGTGVQREATANDVGAFHFGNIGAGTYTMTATAKGFQKYTKSGSKFTLPNTWKRMRR